MQALVLAAGKGTRMRSAQPKVLHEILGWPMLDYVLRTLSELGVRNTWVVIGNEAGRVRAYLKQNAGRWPTRVGVVYQRRQKGTGHAVLTAESVLKRSRDSVLIWPGDMPLLKAETVREMIRRHRAACADASVLSSLEIATAPTRHGRILRAGGRFYAIREFGDCSETERRIQEINTGVYVFSKVSALVEDLRKLRPDNVQKEIYLTDIVETMSAGGRRLEAFPLAGTEEGLGINSRLDLARVTEKMKNREIQYHAERGVTFVAPEQTFIEPGVKIGRDTVIQPWTYIESGVRIGADCRIGPFAKIRRGTQIESGTVIGSFVEVSRSRIGKKVMAKHLSYLGDAVIGDGTNIGAGTITANYDGKSKHRTRLGKKVLVGSDTVFVAPVTVGDGAKTGAGTVVTGGSRIKKGETVVGVPARRFNKKKKKN